jgi:hypothetical protein
MAELRDHYSGTVIHVEITEKLSEFLIGTIHVVFREDVFVTDESGNHYKTRAEIKWHDFWFNRSNINSFVKKANEWLSLPFNQLGSTYFAGQWSFGANQHDIFDIKFDRHPDTPRKTDWFAVELRIHSHALGWSKTIFSDFSCLSLFVEQLMIEMT